MKCEMKCEICGLNLIPLKMGGFAHYESGKLIMDCQNDRAPK